MSKKWISPAPSKQQALSCPPLSWSLSCTVGEALGCTQHQHSCFGVCVFGRLRDRVRGCPAERASICRFLLRMPGPAGPGAGAREPGVQSRWPTQVAGPPGLEAHFLLKRALEPGMEHRHCDPGCWHLTLPQACVLSCSFRPPPWGPCSLQTCVHVAGHAEDTEHTVKMLRFSLVETPSPALPACLPRDICNHCWFSSVLPQCRFTDQLWLSPGL